MSWADIAKKNQHKTLTTLIKEKEVKKKVIDLYPEDVFEMKYINEIQKLKNDIEQEIHDRGVIMLNHKFTLNSFYEFLLYYTDLSSITEDLLNEKGEVLERPPDLKNNGQDTIILSTKF
jgi:hypothetical protein